jgi:general secretion pathway protein G
MPKRRMSSRVFFPWERKEGVLGRLGRTRARMLLSVAAVLFFLVVLFQREDGKAAVRATRATLTVADRAVAAYRADHGGGCPREWTELVAGHYVREAPTDAWGRPLRLTCPGRKDPGRFDLSSDGPDGVPGGLDRVE